LRLAPVIDGHCAGYVLARRHQFEALDSDGKKSLGLFANEQDAVEAITHQRLTNKST
jgi:hypothetical protein